MSHSLPSLNRRSLLGAGLACALPATIVHAQNPNWPSKGRTVKFIVPFVPGGTSDIVGRTVAHELTRIFGTTVMVENKAGGGGVPAMLDVARSPADGYTLIQAHVGSMAVNPFIYSNPGYDVNKDFVPVTLFVKVPSLFVTHPSVPAKSLKELIEYSKQNPTMLNYASAGNASAGHLAIEYLKLTTGLKATHIPYRGTGPALNDLLAGRIHLFSAGTPALAKHIKKGSLRGIATGTKQRLPSLPDMPTVAESGYPGFESVQWYGMLAPAGTPPEVVQRLQEACVTALKSPEVVARFKEEDAVAGGETPAQFAAFIQAEQNRWKDIVAKAGIRAD